MARPTFYTREKMTPATTGIYALYNIPVLNAVISQSQLLRAAAAAEVSHKKSLATGQDSWLGLQGYMLVILYLCMYARMYV